MFIVCGFGRSAVNGRSTLLSPSRVFNSGASTTSADEHPNHLANAESIGLLFTETDSLGEFVVAGYNDGAIAASRYLIVRHVNGGGYRSFFNINNENQAIDGFWAVGNANQTAFTIEGDTTPRMAFNANEAILNTALTNSTSSNLELMQFSRTAGQPPVWYAGGNTTSFVIRGMSPVNSAAFTVNGDISVQSTGQKIWLSTNSYLVADSTTTNLQFITISPALTNQVGLTPL